MHFGEENDFRREGGRGLEKYYILLAKVLSASFLEPLEQLLGSKSHLIIGQKCEIMLDIISAFWEIWLDIVLNTSFFEVFRASFRIKITIDYRPKKSK